jgi:hypothetical protein
LYIDKLINQCLNPEDKVSPISQKCHDEVLSSITSQDKKKFNVDMKIYNTCLKKEEDAMKANSGSFLDIDLDLERSIGAIFHPSISINNHTFRGDYDDPNELFKAICSTMIDRPSICQVKTIVNREEYTPKSVLDKKRDDYIEQET